MCDSSQINLWAQVGDYQIAEALGRGGFGTVWRAVHIRTGEQVAIKFLRPEYVSHAESVARFQREAKVAAMLDHDNVVELLEVGKLADGTPYIVMEYLVGISLDAHLRRERLLSPEAALDILQQLCNALRVAHARSVVHRDIKASNVMLCQQADGSRRVVLLDFGIAKLLEGQEPPITAPLATIGSPYFMAPEQIYGKAVDMRTDIYGLGILAFELLVGVLPFQGHVSAVLCAHIEDHRPAPSEHDDSLRAFDPVIQRAMALEARDRFASVDEFLAAFRAALAAHRGTAPAIAASRGAAVAIGLYVQAEIEIDAQARVDADSAATHDPSARAVCEDAAMDDVCVVLARAHRFLTQREFACAYEFGNVALFALPITGRGAGPVRAAKQRALAAATQLRGHLASRDGAHAWVAIGIHLDIGEVRLSDPSSQEITGGALVDNPPPTFPRCGDPSLTVSPAFNRVVSEMFDRGDP